MYKGHRWNVDAGIKYAGAPNFGFKGIHLYDDDVIAEIYQIRQSAPPGTYAPSVCDEFTSPRDEEARRPPACGPSPSDSAQLCVPTART